MASTQPKEQAELVATILEVLPKDPSRVAGIYEMASSIASAIVDAENVFVGADYVKNERGAGRTILAILTPTEAEQLQAWRLENETI